MGHFAVQPRDTRRRSHVDRRRMSHRNPYTPIDDLNNALGTIRVLGMEPIEDELKPHLNTVLINMRERRSGAPEQVVISGILPILALCLMRRGPHNVLTAKLLAELAKDPVVRKGFLDAGVVQALLFTLNSNNQELLVHAAQTISRMSYYSSKQQEMLLRLGAASRLVPILLRFSDHEALRAACLQALCSLGDMMAAEETGTVWHKVESISPEESLFHGVSPHICGLGSAVTVVRVCHWAPAQYSVSMDVLQRYSLSFWELHGRKCATRWTLLSSFGGCSGLCKTIRCSATLKSLKMRLFHTFL